MKSDEKVIEALLPTLKELEPDRLLYRRNSKIYLSIALLPTIGLVAAGLFAGGPKILFFIGAGVWLVLGLILYSFKAASIGARFRENYKARVVPSLVQTIDPSLHHSADRGIPSSLFVDSELFSTSPDRYSTEDLIEGNYDKTFLQLAEVKAEDRQTYTDSEGRTKTKYVTIFDGLFLVADFHKHFHGRTFIFPDKSEKTFGGLARFFQKAGKRRETNLVQLEDPEFEHQFKVYSSDEVEARYILSTALMRRILEMQARFGKDVRLSFKDSNLILAVPHNRPFLEPNTSVAADNPEQVQVMLTDIRFFLETIEELDLNTRIWTKQ